MTAARWGDLVELFGPNGAYSGCWCMYLRESAKDFDALCPNGGAGNRDRLRETVESGRVPGLLAFLGPRPVGWVSVSPRDDYVRVLRSPVHKPIDDEADVWAVACFFIAKDMRGEGIADALLDAAVAHARRQGARIVEGYPIDPGDARRPSAEMWRGSVDQFTRAGFEVVARRKPARPIVRLHCGAG
ncbi:MAG TPA: GNAT family N-acetyltransferase [Acidimicrobiia bacterium]|nr:GNAT family N-acetyltransferase [Acidimicrobiia bacterium]